MHQEKRQKYAAFTTNQSSFGIGIVQVQMIVTDSREQNYVLHYNALGCVSLPFRKIAVKLVEN
jgi:hypothetical protein